MLEQFWSLEAIGISLQVEPPLSHEEKIAFNRVSESIRLDGERFEVALTWKHERPELQRNRQIAVKRLRTVEKKFLEDEKLAQAYQAVVENYLRKG